MNNHTTTSGSCPVPSVNETTELRLPPQSTAYRATLARIQAGICGVPSVINTKQPSCLGPTGEVIFLKWKHLTTRMLTPIELSAYFASTPQARAHTGCGVILGAHSILEREEGLLSPVCLDFDDKALFLQFQETCAWQGAASILARALLESTPHGYHVAGLVPGLYPTTDLALRPDGHGTLKKRIELKTRFVKTAPSQHYTPVRGEWAALPVFTVGEWDQLIAVALGYHQVPNAPRTVPHARPLTREQRTAPPPRDGYHASETVPFHWRDPGVQGDVPTMFATTEDQTVYTHRPDVVEKLAGFLGLPPPSKGRQFSCILPGHGPDVHPSMTWLPPRHAGETWKVCCHHGGGAQPECTKSLTEVYYFQVHGVWPRLNKSSYGAWTLKLLRAAGLVRAPVCPFPALPKDAPSYAIEGWKDIQYLYETRAIRSGVRHSLPLVWDFVKGFVGKNLHTEYQFEHAMQFFLHRGLLQGDGTAGGAMLFRFGTKRVRRRCAATPLAVPPTLTAGHMATMAVQAEVLHDAAPVRRAGQKDGYPLLDTPGIVSAECVEVTGGAPAHIEGVGPWDVP